MSAPRRTSFVDQPEDTGGYRPPTDHGYPALFYGLLATGILITAMTGIGLIVLAVTR